MSPCFKIVEVVKAMGNPKDGNAGYVSAQGRDQPVARVPKRHFQKFLLVNCGSQILCDLNENAEAFVVSN